MKKSSSPQEPVLVPTLNRRSLIISLLASFPMMGCGGSGSAAEVVAPPPVAPPPALPPFKPNPAPGTEFSTSAALLADLEKKSFLFFWETANPKNGLIPDRWPQHSRCSVAAVGFGLSACPIGIERGWITREQGRERVLTTLRFFANAPQGNQATGVTGYKGFFYHFIDMQTGFRGDDTVELSSVDTALLLAGMLHCQSWFSGEHADEVEIRRLVDLIYGRVDWTWMQARGQAIAMGWFPENGGRFHGSDWKGYNEAMIVYLLALGSPTHPVAATAWNEWTSSYGFSSQFGSEPHVTYPCLFIHQFSHAWVDFRGMSDEYMRGKGFDYAENSRRATLAQRNYAKANPKKLRGYSDKVWGVTATDGPGKFSGTVDGLARSFSWYEGRTMNSAEDDGTISPYGAISSLPFTRAESEEAAMAMYAGWGKEIYGKYGFFAFNPTFVIPAAVKQGRVVADLGWINTDFLGIEVGPLLLMLANARDGSVWKTMKANPYLLEGLRKAKFQGGWVA